MSIDRLANWGEMAAHRPRPRVCRHYRVGLETPAVLHASTRSASSVAKGRFRRSAGSRHAASYDASGHVTASRWASVRMQPMRSVSTRHEGLARVRPQQLEHGIRRGMGATEEPPPHGGGIIEDEGGHARPWAMRSRLVTPSGRILALRCSYRRAAAEAGVRVTGVAASRAPHAAAPFRQVALQWVQDDSGGWRCSLSAAASIFGTRADGMVRSMSLSEVMGTALLTQ